MTMRTKVKALVTAGLMVLLMLVPTHARGQVDVDLLVSADWLEAHLDDSDVVVLHADMRRDGYEAGHLPGGRFLDMTQLVWDGEHDWGAELRSPAEIDAALEAAGVSDGQHIVVYADNPLFAARAFMTLEVMGLVGHVSMLDGGLGGWKEDGRDVTSAEPDIQPGSIRLSPRDDIVVSADWINERLDSPTLALVDARPDDEYTGADGGMDGRANPGHIPGAAQMYWEELITNRPIPRMLERGTVEELFHNAGVADGDTVVAYCMVGYRASFTYFAARMLGYDTKFYDGSWRDWGTRDDLPYVSGNSRR
jgi:thiosulfate/3-mercaptopyruvate sulfurtransferase